MIITTDATNKSLYFNIVGDASHASPGDPITGLLFSDIETGGSASYVRQGAARVDLELITLASASAAHSDGGFIEVDATNMPGVYRCDFPDAAWATGVDQVICQLVAAAANNARIDPVVVDLSEVIVNPVWDEPLTGGTHNVPTSSGRRLRGLQDFQTYSSYIWVDTVDGVAGVIAGENGTENNPVLTWSDALTLEGLTETPSKRFHIANDSTITWSASVAAYTMNGAGWSLAMNGQVMDDVYVIGAKVSGIGTNSTGHAHFDFCEFGACTIGNIHCHSVHIESTIDMANTGSYFFANSHSGVVGVGQPVFNFGAVGAQDLALRDWDGSAEIQNMAAGDNCSIDGKGRNIIINANCTGGTIVIAGIFNLTDNSGGAVTIIDDARIDYDQIRHSVWLDKLTEYTDGEAGKRLRGISAVPTAEGTVNDAAATTTTFITTLTGYEDNHFADGLCVVEIAPDRWQSKPVLSSNGTTGQIVLGEALTSAPANGVAIAIQADHVHPLLQIATAVANYDMGNSRTIVEALAFLRNKWEIVAGTLIVYDTDDTTVLWSSTMVQTPGNPVSSSDPTS